ncbi:MAG: cyclic nucleotide-binding domain-containing protein [Cyclobacteriaceae bacterium]|nr:cyclic nucleotide-binding domain-containing protein [Cyclobacteriaceae bacterium]
MDKSWFQKSRDVGWLKSKYFNDDAKRIYLKKGEVLLRPNSYNDKLYLICKGVLKGYIEDEHGELFEIFNSSNDMFVGVYSFFSSEHKSYSTVVAAEDTVLGYIDHSQAAVASPDFAQHFLPVVVNEIYLRQLLAGQMSLERQAAMKKLAETEKMSTLGQLAAGIAHELNNAIGVVHRNTELLAQSLKEYFELKEPGLFSFFTKSLERGQRHSSSFIRERRKEIEQKYKLSARIAKQLAKANVENEQIEQLLKSGLHEFKPIQFLIDTGVSLHDMNVASTQAAHVVKSVRELGNTQKITLVETDINETIREALSLTKNMLLGIKLSIVTEVEGKLLANPGDLVQVWVNLIKNACESLKHEKTQQPEIEIKTWEENKTYNVCITDNGPGISADLLPRIFQPNVTTKVDGLSFGLGLGLSILKKIVESYQGAVSVSSQPGRTSFIVQLPKKI